MMMKSLTVCLVLGIVLAMSLAISATEESEALTMLDTDKTQMPDDNNVPAEKNNEDDNDDDDEDNNTTVSLRGFGRLLSSKKKKKAYDKPQTCDKNPKVCRAKGSTKKDCCKKKCVSKANDRLNCGKCGKKCKFSQSCCKGKCVNTMTDKNNCGACGRKCKKQGRNRKCRYGMCNYAHY